MTNSDLLTYLFSQYLTQTPTMLVCLVACLLVLSGWRETGRGTAWALAGFGLALAITVVWPVTQTLLLRWQFEGHIPSAQIGKAYGVVGMIWSCLHALSYGFLVVAFLTGRSRRSEVPPLPPASVF